MAGLHVYSLAFGGCFLLIMIELPIIGDWRIPMSVFRCFVMIWCSCESTDVIRNVLSWKPNQKFFPFACLITDDILYRIWNDGLWSCVNKEGEARPQSEAKQTNCEHQGNTRNCCLWATQWQTIIKLLQSSCKHNGCYGDGSCTLQTRWHFTLTLVDLSIDTTQ